MLPLLAASALVVAPLALANDSPAPSGNGVNSIKCTAIAIGDASTYSRDAFVDLGVEFAAQVCGDGEGFVSLEVTYEKIAVAIAKAVATTYVECTTEGQAVYGEAEAYAHASTSTEAYAEALGAGWASIETCFGCKAGAELFVASSKELFAEATAQSRSELAVYGAKENGVQKFMAVGEVVKSIEAVVARTYAQIAIEVEAAVNQEEGTQSCRVKVEGCTKAGDESGCCELEVSSAAEQVSTVAIAEAAAGAEAVAYTCGEQYSDAEANAYAKAIAFAFAKAVSAADGYCYSTDRSSACAWAGSSVSAFAYAQATAFAEAWAVAGNECNCALEVATVTEAFQEIFLEAHSSLEAEICTDGGLAGIEILQEAYSEVTITAIADALASAWQSSDSCGASVFACAETGSAYQLDYACCEVSVDNYPVDLSKDGYAEAVAFAGAFSCATDEATLEAASETFVTATAQAIAKAVIEIDSFCVSTERAGFCSLMEGHITAHAQAQATAFANAWAGTAFDCPCEVSAEAISTSVKDVFAQATARVSEELCKFGEAFEYTADQITTVVEKERTALAAAFAEVRSNGKNCKAVVGVDTDTSTDPDATLDDPPVSDESEKCADCVGSHETCWVKGNDVLGCCDDGFECIQRSPSRASCKKPGSNAAQRYTRFGFGETKYCPTS